VTVVVREIDRGGKVSLDIPGNESASDGDSSGDRPERSSEGGGGSRDRDRDRDRGGNRSQGSRGGNRGGRGGDRQRRDRDRGSSAPAQPKSDSDRTVVSFEDDFEKGI
jgi:hypothetical protein